MGAPGELDNRATYVQYLVSLIHALKTARLDMVSDLCSIPFISHVRRG